MNRHHDTDTKCQARSSNAASTARSSHSPPRRCASRRGSVLIAVIITLIMVQIVVIGVVTLAARDQNLTNLRLESQQAQYAAESAMSMALREVYNSADEDTDGGIGTISAKTVNGCTVAVTSSTAGSTTTLTATATSSSASRKVVAALGS